MQLQTIRVCQICGRATPSDQAEGWLVSPRKADPQVLVIRCPWHISEWALRQSYAGRTKEWRERIANPPPPPSIHPLMEPMVAFDIQEEGDG